MNKFKNYLMKLWLIPLILIGITIGCDERDGITYPPTLTIPTVSSTNPANSTTNVPFNQNVSASFSEVMNSSSLTTATFTLMQGTSFVSGTVSYSGTTAVFKPSSNLTPNTLYTATITTGAKDMEGSALAGNYVWSFTTGAAAVIIAPTVISTDPVNAATSVALNQKIAATFSTPMDASTFTSASFLLRQGSIPIAGFVSYTGTTAIFAPSVLLSPNTAYTVILTDGVKDLAGNSLANEYVWGFTTGASVVITPPVVSFTDPANLATGVALNQKIAATFSKTMDASTMTASIFTLKQGSTSVSGFVSYTGTTALFTPGSNLAANTVYTATITTGAKDLAGNPLANNYTWSFTTGAAVVVTPPTVISTDPINVAAGVALNQKVSATFSKTMDASSIQSSTFILRHGTTAVSGFISYSGATAIFTPASFLMPNTLYSATITTGATDLAGNNLASNYNWSFTTGASAVITPPVVSFTDPSMGATGVALNQKVAATFSKTMDASTLTAATYTLKQGSTPVTGFVSYSGTTAIFTPANNLSPNTEYTGTITTSAKDLAGNALESNYVWNFTTGAAAVVTPPVVLSTDPNNLATNVALNQKINATFSKAMDATTIQTSTFVLRNGTTAVTGFVSYSGITAIFTPASNLSANTVYTATITTGAKDLAGNALVNDYVWSFTTGAAVVVTPPVIISTDPINGATGVVLNQKVVAMFSKTMDATTLTNATYTLKQGANSITGFVSYSGTTAIFTPASNLSPNTIYTATITTGAEDLAGNALENNFVWNFTTGAAAVVTPPVVISTDPLNSATGVGLNQKVAATFSKTMDASTLTNATYTLKQGANSITGFVSYSGTTAIFSPASNLSPNTVYTATITTGAKDLAGNALANNYVWSFTTGATTVIVPPTVILTDPLNLATDVALNKQVAATFSKTMDASTITGATFTLKRGTTPVTGFVSYSGAVAVFTPAANLLQNTLYTATITTGAKDLAGNALANNYVWSFTTGAAATGTPPTIVSTDPYSDEICVPVNKHITATFSKQMESSTITTAIFTIMEVNQATFISGTVSYSGTTATFVPLIDLKPNTTYTGTITTGAKDLAGNTLAKNHVWNFTTVAPLTVSLSSDPLLGGITSGGGTFNSCSSVTVTATPNLGYSFTNWTENGLEVSRNENYTFTLNGNRSLVAHFTNIQYTVTLSSLPQAGGNTNGGGTFNANSSVTVTATPNLGYSFVNWTENGNIASTNSNYTFVLNGNRTLVANFALIPQYTVTLSSNPPLGGSTSGGGTFNSGASVTVIATANGGYTFKDWTENGNPVSTNSTYTFNINGNRTLTANFEPVIINQYLVTLSSQPPLGGTTSGGGTYNSGSNVTITANAEAGYVFTNWTEAGNPVSNNASYSFVILGDRTFVANFTVVQSGPAGVNLRSAGDFAILAGSGISSTGLSTVYGDAGSFPTATINGFPPGVVIGTLYVSADPIVGLAKDDLTTAYNDAQGRSLDAISLPGQIGGLTLAPGLYVNSTTSGISGTGANGILTLDAGGNPNAVWIFKVGSTFITDSGTSIVLAGGAKWENIYWSVGTSATLGTNSIFYGNILADQSITLTTGAVLRGRALTRIAAVTLDASVVDKRP